MSDERKQKKKTMIFKIRVMPLFLKRCVFFARAEITIQDDCHNWRDSYIYLLWMILVYFVGIYIYVIDKYYHQQPNQFSVKPVCFAVPEKNK